MSVDIYNSRRTNYHKCKYWLRDENGHNDNEQLILNKKPDGIFYARVTDTDVRDEMAFGGVFQFNNEKLHIETSDDINGLRKNDKVEFMGKMYVVDYVSQRMINKRSEFISKNMYITSIYLRA